MEGSVSKFINCPKNVVQDCIEGLAMVDHRLGILEGTQVVALRKLTNKVHLVGGGGSGHQPADAGFVYQDGLSAAVCGGPFSSPSSEQVLAAIQYVDTKQGVLLIIKNYTGDIINFEIAKQTAQLSNIHVESLTVRDDIAFIEDDPKRENARGLSGLVLVYQILGNLACQGASLKDLVREGHSISDRLFTLNVALGACSLPGNPPGFTIGANTFQLGLGIHGQKGKQTFPYQSIGQIASLLNSRFNAVLKSKNIVMLLNNLGGCSQMEVSIILGSLVKSFSSSGYKILRVIEGRLVTSFQMHGFSLTIFQEPTTLQLANIDCPNPNWKLHSAPILNTTIPFKKDTVKCMDENKTYQSTQTAQAVKQIISWVTSKCQHLDEIDREVGDGDTGTSINRSLEFVTQNNIIQKLDFENHTNTSLRQIGRLVATKSAGTLGSILGAFIMSVSIELKPQENQNRTEQWTKGIEKGLATIRIVGKCSLGERTILDVLHPIWNYLTQKPNEWTFEELYKVAQTACQSVTSLKATKGRSRYLGGKEVGHPDSGCQLVKMVIQALRN